MIEQLGIVTRYTQHEVTYAAIHLAEAARQFGVTVSIFGVDTVRRHVSRLWDPQVVTEKQQSYSSWAAQRDMVVWTHFPTREVMVHTTQLGPRTAVLVDWESMRMLDYHTAEACDCLLFPHHCIARAVRKQWTLPNTAQRVLPWDVPVPHMQRNDKVPHTRIRMQVPLYDSQPHRVDRRVFNVIKDALHASDDVDVMIACGRSWALSSRKVVKDLRRQHGPRIVLVMKPNLLQRILLFAKTDITLWVPRFESFGSIGLASLCAGAPVISWEMEPMTEFLSPWRNSVLAIPEVEENWVGVPAVTRGYSNLSEAVVSTLQDKGLIAKMKANVGKDLEQRRKHFNNVWGSFLERSIS